MILYFSGTGNSRLVANELASVMNEHAYDMASLTALPQIQAGESLGLVFPVYAWGLPQLVAQFIDQRMYPLRQKPAFVWVVMTCGDDMGYADEILNKHLLQTVNWQADAIYSVQMPNTYVCLPGFDIDSPDDAQRKVITTQQRLPDIADWLLQRRRRVEVVRGGSPWMKTYILRPLFNRFLVTDRKFRVNKERCTGCQLCTKECPTHDIQCPDKTPVWQHQNCTGCLRCYHQCPQRAIDWGRYTRGKGQKAPIGFTENNQKT